MKTIQKTIEVFNYEELSDEAKARALKDWQDNDIDKTLFLEDDLREYIHEELKERGYTVEGVSTSANPSIRPLYSLSYCQGDGLMFEGTVSDKKDNVYTIKHGGGLYYHENSKDISITDKDGNDIDGQIYEDFDTDYQVICRAAAERGYQEIEYANSEEAFIEACEANEYNFLASGEMVNEN